MFKFVDRVSIKGKLCLIILISAVSYLSLTLRSLSHERAVWKERIEEKGVKVNEFLANISAIPIQTSDYVSIINYIKDLKEDEEIAYVIVYKGDDIIITREEARIKESLPDRSQIKTVCADITFYGERIGRIETGISLHKMNRAMEACTARIVSLLAVQGALVLILVLLVRAILKPIRFFTGEVKGISTRSIGHQIRIETKDEIGELADAFNKMSSRLHESHESLESRVRERTAELARANTDLETKHQQLLSMFDGIDEVVYVADPYTHEMLYMNGPAREHWGDGVGQKCHRVLQNLDSPCPFCTNDRLFGENTGDAYIWESQNTVNRRWYRCIDKAIHWPDGRTVRFEMAIDITERKRAEKELHRSETKFRTLHDSSSDAVMLLDQKGFFDCNNATVRIFGCKDKAEFCSKHPSDVSPPAQPCGTDSMTLANERIATAMKNGSNRFEWMHKRLDTGEPFPAEVLLNAMGLDGRQVLQAVVRDITERKQAEEQLREHANLLKTQNYELASQRQQLQAQQEDLVAVNQALEGAMASAEEATRAKSEFLANMSHEIRTPMTAILGFADILLEHGNLDNAPPERIEAAETIKRNGEYLLGIINDILDLSKVEAGKMTIERIRCSPCRIVAEVASLVQVRADAKGLPFEIQYIGAIPETIQTDPTRLRQVLINLIGNAIKFTEVGSVRLITRFVEGSRGQRIKGSTDAEEPPSAPLEPSDPGTLGPYLEFDIVDTGLGMSDEQVAKLFQPFMQADTSTMRKFGGTGLGLTISKRLALLLGGDITVVETAKGVGAHFRVTVATGPLDGVRMIEDPLSAMVLDTGSAAPAEAGGSGRGKLDCRILFAEDGPDNQRLLSHVLKQAGAKVVVVENGRLAADAALAARDEGNPFDVILMDMQMPVMDGYEATGLLRQAGYTGPIIALTAHAMASDREKCLSTGCDDYAAKPIDRKKLIETITTHLKRECLSVE